MEIVALVLAVLALLVALGARAKAGALTRSVEDTRTELRRTASNLGEEVERVLTTMRQHLAAVAAGTPPTRGEILEGRLWSDLSPAEGLKLVAEEQPRLIDVRTPEETAGGIIPGALLIPIDTLEERVREIPRDGKKTLLYCAGGGRSAAGCELLSSLGYTNLANLDGGFSSWTGPVERPRTAPQA